MRNENTGRDKNVGKISKSQASLDKMTDRQKFRGDSIAIALRIERYSFADCQSLKN